MKPSEINHNNVIGILNDWPKEVVIRNIIIISKQNNDEWFSFTWEEWLDAVTYEPNWEEKAVMNDLVEAGLLSLDNEKYSVTENLINKLA